MIQIIQGFNSADTTGKEIEKLIDVAKTKDKVNTLDEYVANGDYSKISSNGSVCRTSKCSISGRDTAKELIVNIPFINKTVDLSKYSLPLVSFILGSIDGVNPCASCKTVWLFLMIGEGLTCKNLCLMRMTCWDFSLNTLSLVESA